MFNLARRIRVFNTIACINKTYFLNRNLHVQLSHKIGQNTPYRCIQVSPLVNNPSAKAQNCWKCAESVRPDKFFCDKCNVIQKSVDDVDYYQLFGVQESFEIDEEDLSTKFKRMQMLLHPDKFSMKSPEELALAEEYSSLINKAYSVLRDPWTRGVYLLKKLGVSADEETTVKNPSLLMYVMERNEAIAAAKEINHVLRVDVANKADISSVIIKLYKAFEKRDLEMIQNELVKLKYFTNMDAKISERKLEFGVTD